MNVFALIAYALALASGLFVVFLVARSAWLEHQERRWRGATETVRPAVLELIEGDATASEDLTGTEAQAFESLLGRYAVSLRGEARARITRWFETHGAVERELERLTDPRAWRRAQAAFALGDMGSAAAIPALVAALQDRNSDVRSAATRSLGHLRATEAIEPAIHAAIAQRVPRSVVTAAAIEMGAPVAHELPPLFDHEEARVRSAAVELFGLLDISGDAEPIVASLGDPSPRVRAAAATALERVADASAAASVRTALSDSDASVRAAAATALGTIGGDESLETLLEVARGDDFEPARAAAHAAARIDPARVRAAADAAGAGQFMTEAADLAAL